MRRIVFYNDPRFKTFVILIGEQLCGYCILARYKERDAYSITAEATLYLQPEFTRKGIGSSALKFLETQARRNGFHSIIGVVCGENTASIRCCEKKRLTKMRHV